MMRFPRVFGVGCLAVSLALVFGCSDTPKQGTSDSGDKRIETVSLEKLPQLDDPLPSPLDEGRIEVASPTKWHIAPQSTKWIVRFQGRRGDAYPSIFVTAEDYKQREKVFDVDEDNVDEFAGLIDAAFKADRKRLTRDVGAIKIGRLVGVTYGREGTVRADFKEVVLERQFVETVVAGRKYTVELRAREGDSKKYRPYLLAAAGGIKFLEPTEAEPPGEKPPEQPPGEPPETPAEASPQESPPKRLQGLVAAGSRTFSQIKFPRDSDVVEWTVAGKPIQFDGKKNSSSGSVSDADGQFFEIGAVENATATIAGEKIEVVVQFVTFKAPISDRARAVAVELGVSPEGTALVYQDGKPKYLAYRSGDGWVFFDCDAAAESPQPKSGSLERGDPSGG